MDSRSTLLFSVACALLPFASFLLPQSRPTEQSPEPDAVEVLVQPGASFTVSSDLEVSSRNILHVAGDLIARTPSGDVAEAHGPDIRLRSERAIVVTGRILGAAGRDAFTGEPTPVNCRLEGGRGSNVELIAPIVVINGRVMAGHGGRSGPNAEGGPGGCADILGRLATTVPISWDAHSPRASAARLRADEHGVAVLGGDGGGHLGRSLPGVGGGGRGGRGGDVTVRPFDGGRSVTSHSEFVAIQRACGMAPAEGPQPWASTFACPDGSPGSGPAPLVGGNGNTGDPGNHGSQSSPQGQTGDPGGTGGTVNNTTGGNPGGDAPDCCSEPGPGGKGGKGGPGGAAYGGDGGDGGQGGDGYYDAATQQYQGNGGLGGKGGDGGSASSGVGGKGGKGGAPNGPKGEKGDPGTADGGDPGTGGAGGFGRTGQVGTLGPGDEGTPHAGTPGEEGEQGGDCPGGGGGFGGNEAAGSLDAGGAGHSHPEKCGECA